MVRPTNVQTFQIREASIEDIPKIMMINRICLPENYTYFFFESILKGYPKSFLIAEIDEEIVGYIMCRVERSLSKFEKMGFKKLGHIISIAILPEYRRRGLARSLLENALKILKEDYECEEAYLEVRVSNSAAISLYKKCGFTVIRVAKGYYIDGEDAYVMARKL